MLGRLLAPALVVVLVTDLVGGLADVAAGRSSLSSAWSSAATLCAPWPMVAFQVAAFLCCGAAPHARPGWRRSC